MDIHLTLRPTGEYGSKSEFYEVVHDGKIIVRSTDPECEACRVLEARELSGKAHFWREGKTTWDIRMGTRWGARHRIAETAHIGPVFAPWKPFPIEQLKNQEFEEMA